MQASPFAKTLYCLSPIVVYAAHDTICAQSVSLKASNCTAKWQDKPAARQLLHWALGRRSYFAMALCYLSIIELQMALVTSDSSADKFFRLVHSDLRRGYLWRSSHSLSVSFSSWGVQSTSTACINHSRDGNIKFIECKQHYMMVLWTKNSQRWTLPPNSFFEANCVCVANWM